jgi:hypothetical protein
VLLLACFFVVLVIKTVLDDDDDVIVSRYSRVSDAEAGALSLFSVFFFLCTSLSVGGTFLKEEEEELKKN